MVNPDTHPAGIAPHVVDAVGDRLAQLGVGEVVHVDPFRLARRLPFDPGVGELADQFLFFGVHADDRLPGGQVGGGLVVDVTKLGITVGVLGAFQGLAGPLQRVPLSAQQPRHGRAADAVSASASWRVDLVVHRSGDSGSPRVTGSTSASKAASRPGSASASGLGPAPGARTRPVGSGSESSSAMPRRTLGRVLPASSATRVTPPWPRTRANPPNSSRRCRSVRWGSTSAKPPASTSSRSTPGTYPGRPNSGKLNALRSLCRSRPTVDAQGMRSIGSLVCVH